MGESAVIQALIFDVYGTLISTGSGSVDAARKILQKLGSPLPAETFYSRWKVVHKELTVQTQKTGFLPEQEIFRRGLWRLYKEYGLQGDADTDVQIMLDSLTGRKAFPDVLSGLMALRKSYRVYLGSNTDAAPLMENLRQCGIAVDGVYTSQSLGCYKPDPAFYRRLLQRISVPPGEAVFVGDSYEEDVVGPKQAGMKALWLNRKGSAVPAGPVCPDEIFLALPTPEQIGRLL